MCVGCSILTQGQTEKAPLAGPIVCRGVNPPPPIIGYLPIFRILLPPPPTSQHLSLSLTASKYITSISVKPCYDHLMKAIEEWQALTYQILSDVRLCTRVLHYLFVNIL